MEILKNAAPLFVHLLDDDDGIGVVRFDTDAEPAPPADAVQVAGSQIAGVGRNDALQAISTHATNPAGLTAIGDGVEVASSQLAAASDSSNRRQSSLPTVTKPRTSASTTSRIW